MPSKAHKARSASAEWNSKDFARVLRESLDTQRWFARLRPDLRDEVVQDTLESLLHRTGKEVVNPLAYAVRTARNRAHFLLARASKYQSTSDDDFVSVQDSTPESSVAASESRRRLEEAVRRLPPRQQQVVRLVLEDGMRVDDVAQVLKMKRDSVYQHLSRAIRRLRDEVG